VYQEHVVFYTDQYAVYTGIIPPARHQAITKLARKTNHIGATKYFICHYNLTKCAALPK